ncbi:MAG: helix-turn-helix transcriptional regulator [Victivallales bacterium]
MKNTAGIGKAIQSYCEATGQTNVDLAKRLDVNKSTVGRWVSGKASEIKPVHWVALKLLINSHLTCNIDWNKSLEETIIEDNGLSSSAKLRIIDIIKKDKMGHRPGKAKRG